MLSRKTFEKSQLLHSGIWQKSATNSHEVRGLKLGIIGYGHIGSQVSVLAEALGMEVYFYNTSERQTFGKAIKCYSMDELVKVADIITIHVSGKPENKNLMNEKVFKKMRDGVLLLNASRGYVVDIDALVTNLKSGKVAGAAIDVFPTEPLKNGDPFTTPLQKLPNVILTPHLGSGTEEAQKNIARYVPEKIIDFINRGNTYLSVNIPNIQLPEQGNTHRFLHLHKNVPGVMAKINTIFGHNAINIVGQYLKTNENIGYVITDVDKQYNEKVLEELKKIEDTIRFRILY
jgi:D-3-phosphoglycerate dehydrogenase